MYTYELLAELVVNSSTGYDIIILIITNLFYVMILKESA